MSWMKPTLAPNLRPFTQSYSFTNWIKEAKPLGDFCWVAKTDTGRFRMVESFNPYWREVEEQWVWLHASIGEFKTEGAIEAAA